MSGRADVGVLRLWGVCPQKDSCRLGDGRACGRGRVLEWPVLEEALGRDPRVPPWPLCPRKGGDLGSSPAIATFTRSPRTGHFISLCLHFPVRKMGA